MIFWLPFGALLCVGAVVVAAAKAAADGDRQAELEAERDREDRFWLDVLDRLELDPRCTIKQMRARRDHAEWN